MNSAGSPDEEKAVDVASGALNFSKSGKMASVPSNRRPPPQTGAQETPNRTSWWRLGNHQKRHQAATSLDEQRPRTYEGLPEPGGKDPPPVARRASPEAVNSLVNNLSLGDPRSQQASLSHKRVGAETPPQDSKRTKSNHNASAQTTSTPHFNRSPVQVQQSALDKLVRGSYTQPYEDAPASPVEDDGVEEQEVEPTLLLQPETRRITQEQLINEVKGIYAGLVMVEKKCVEITQARAKSANRLSNDQWQALIALHRTLLQEHHDFFLASQHPTASPALRRLAKKYAMPARMWRHGIHSFLELLRQQLPDSLEHMLAFVYIAYSMMALLMESVPSFLETWIECLGDLARYRMAIEEADMRDREVWSNVARTWYNKAADRSPNTGRIQHHLAVLARPNIVQQLFYYSKSLVSVQPFDNARDSIMLLFNPLLDPVDSSYYEKYPLVEASFVTASAILFKRVSIEDYHTQIQRFIPGLSEHISRFGAKWKTQGPEVAAALFAACVDFGNEENHLWSLFKQHLDAVQSRRTTTEVTDLFQLDIEDSDTRDVLFNEFWKDFDSNDMAIPRAPTSTADQTLTSEVVTVLVLETFRSVTAINADKMGDRNIVPYMSFVLSFVWALARVGRPLIYLEAHIPWSSLVLFLNTLGRSGVSEERIHSTTFPESVSGTGRQIPEDFPARGAMWAQHIFPADFFRHNVTDEDERTLELPSHTAPRCERCLWFGLRLASLDRYIVYDKTSGKFSVTDFALSLEQEVVRQSAFGPSQSHTLAERPSYTMNDHRDVEMLDAATLEARTAEVDSEYVVIDRASTAAFGGSTRAPRSGDS